MHIRRAVLLASVLAQVVGLAACGMLNEPKTNVNELCGKFSFTVAGKSDASKARLAFYDANIRFRDLDFADNRLTGSSSFILGGQVFVIDFPDRYMYRDGDPPLTLHVRAISTVINTPTRQTTPCTGPESGAYFDKIKAAISEKWTVRVEHRSSKYDS